MTFDVAASSYDRFMGRYSRPLAPLLASFAGIASGERALDVGAGTGALTAELVARLGARAVAAVDPSAPFVAALIERFPGVDVREASAEALPFEDSTFDVALAQLVVHFMSDPVAGLGEMARVTRPDGVVAACVWDHGGGKCPLGAFWTAARELDGATPDESHLPGVREGHLAQLFHAAGLRDVASTAISVTIEHPSFDEWWTPFTLGVGPAGQYVQRLDDEARDQLRQRCRKALGPGPFEVTAIAWAAKGRS
jgi:SAM-dependent methyltransferase